MTAKYPTHLYPGCPCYRCDKETWDQSGLRFRGGDLLPQRMSLCPSCGDKRCPGSADHTKHVGAVPVGDRGQQT